MDISELFLNTQYMQFDLTVFLSVLAICLTAMGTLVRIYGNKEIKDEDKPGLSTACKIHQETNRENRREIQTLSDGVGNVVNGIETLRDRMSEVNAEINNSHKDTENLKNEYKTLNNQLDILVKQLLDLLN